jgi:hypothetical protein
MSEVIQDYVNPYAVTNNILQDARNHAKADLFGKPDDNIRYAYAIQQTIRDMGHVCDLICTGRCDVIRMVQAVILKEELTPREHANKPTLEQGTPRKEFVNDWLLHHKVALTNALGMDDGPEIKFLTGILVAPSTSKVQAQFLQDVIQANAANMSFGKYTLFSAYASTANMTMAALGFAIPFGNKDKNNWTEFWKFIKNTHPIVNLNKKTIITNQDKGSIASIMDIIPEAALFHCSFHHCQNIIKKYGGGKGHVPLSCLWMYQLLVKCNLPGLIQFLRLKYEHQMSPAHVNYLNSISNKQQFPTVRCAMAETVCMCVCVCVSDLQ